jgi:hypothetical protein
MFIKTVFYWDFKQRRDFHPAWGAVINCYQQNLWFVFCSVLWFHDELLHVTYALLKKQSFSVQNIRLVGEKGLLSIEVPGFHGCYSNEGCCLGFHTA